jgi:hypothetical protein
MISSQSEQWISLYPHYKNNSLPYSGGILEQPAAYLEVMKIIDNYVNEPKK